REGRKPACREEFHRVSMSDCRTHGATPLSCEAWPGVRLRASAAADRIEGLARHGVGRYGPADRKLALRIDGLLTSRAGPFAGSSLWRGSRATPLHKSFSPPQAQRASLS